MQRKDLLLPRNHLQKIRWILNYTFDFIQCLTSFPSIGLLLCHYASFLMLFHIWSKKDQVLSIKPSANVLVFGDFNNHHKEWMTYSSGTDRPGEHCSNFCTSNGLTQIVRFPTGSLTVTITVLLFWIYFIPLMVVFALQ